MPKANPKKAEEFLQLLSEHRDSFYRFCLHVIWDKNSAEDVLQDAILSAYNGFDRFKPGTDFRGWMYRFLINKIFNHNKKFRKDLQLKAAWQDVNLLETLEKESAYSSILQDPQALFEKLEDRVKTALLSLGPGERMVFLLRAVEGFKYKEIADFLGIPLGTVMSHLFRARAKLRESLSEYARQRGYK
ncbi:MAG: RNA polymerase sigma factor [Candidatus Brocadiales bacterium]